MDVYALPMTPDARTGGEPIALVASKYDERDAQFSPDAKWIAYQARDVFMPPITVILNWRGPSPSSSGR